MLALTGNRGCSFTLIFIRAPQPGLRRHPRHPLFRSMKIVVKTSVEGLLGCPAKEPEHSSVKCDAREAIGQLTAMLSKFAPFRRAVFVGHFAQVSDRPQQPRS